VSSGRTAGTGVSCTSNTTCSVTSPSHVAGGGKSTSEPPPHRTRPRSISPATSSCMTSRLSSPR
jgi:hypothetical protein